MIINASSVGRLVHTQEGLFQRMLSGQLRFKGFVFGDDFADYMVKHERCALSEIDYPGRQHRELYVKRELLELMIGAAQELFTFVDPTDDEIGGLYDEFAAEEWEYPGRNAD